MLKFEAKKNPHPVQKMHPLMWIVVGALGMMSCIPTQVSALTISPFMHAIEGEPGSVHTMTIQLKNDEQFLEEVVFTVRAFEAGEVEGVPEFSTNNRDVPVPWISVPQSGVAMDAGETIPVDVSVTIPPHAEPGGYYAAVFAKTRPPGNSPSVRSSNEIGILYFITVEGDITRTATVTEPAVQPTRVTGVPYDISFVITNTGNVHIQPKGVVSIKNIFSGSSHVVTINNADEIVLPGSHRTISQTWSPDSLWYSVFNPFRFGVFEATIDLDGQAEEREQSVRFMLHAPAAYVLIVSGLAWLYRKKRKKRRI